ncbi:NAD(+) diphosphatase [Microterricola pindariensis]|uniref:NAD(+) diphosphatase n=1 Tax=Microterricola pindariensis TaxID=478010 RepID=A0ABX5AUK3_9MICO|nr:NAD(+) diphosphatase [Microterricola pindariensis]PPL18630.1 hypothetical protein GY24_10135 [Microterricola pindariensis]
MLTDALPLARHRLDRDATARADPELVRRLRADAGTRVLVLSAGSALRALQIDGAAPALAWLSPAELPDAAGWLYLGREAVAGSVTAQPLLAALLTVEQAEALQPERLRWAGLRALAPVLGDVESALFTEAIAVANWHDSHGFCPRCGTATVVEQAGWVRRCPAENTEVFPRTDAAVIVRITDAEDRILLGSNALWEQNRFSLLAGFVEPGESLEDAVRREVLEESGLRVADPRYLGSQPWPFPASLMLGFAATLAAGQSPQGTIPDGEEIIELRWFSRAELRAAGDDILLPGPISIAGAIIREWLENPEPVTP